MNGNSDYTVTVDYGKNISEPEKPDKAGYAFMGWYLGDTLYEFSNPVTRSITLTAHWTDAIYVSFNTLVSSCTIKSQNIVWMEPAHPNIWG